jgi:thiol:disulfide interchange protein DsbD
MFGLRALTKILILSLLCLLPSMPTWAQDGAASSARAGATSGKLATDPVKLGGQLEKLYGVNGYPALIFLDRQGNVRKDLQAGDELTHQGMIAKLRALNSGVTAAPAGGEKNAGGWLRDLQQATLGWQLLLVFFGGLLLNLTPCVYPMIPITVGYFGAQSEGRVKKTFVLALFYVLGLALVYSALGIFAALTGSLFGSLMKSSWVVGGVAVVLLLFGLSMMGLFTIQPPQALMSRSGAKKGVFGALSMGALLGIVAAPCVGPVVAALLTYVGTKQDVGLGFLLFFVLSLGLGLPYLLLGTFSGSIKSMPRSGPWMERLKKIFAVPILFAAVYYGYLALKPVLAPKPATTPVTVVPAGHWAPVTAAALEKARSENRPVVLDFRADWCLPCLKMEKEILSKPDVHKAAGDAVLLQVDRTSATG